MKNSIDHNHRPTSTTACQSAIASNIFELNDVKEYCQHNIASPQIPCWGSRRPQNHSILRERRFAICFWGEHFAATKGRGERGKEFHLTFEHLPRSTVTDGQTDGKGISTESCNLCLQRTAITLSNLVNLSQILEVKLFSFCLTAQLITHATKTYQHIMLT